MRNEDPLITVIIPIYNIMDCLERCVSSVCAQTYRNLEILLVDDGSTDGTGALCDRLAERDGRIRVFHKENGGSSSARNLGLQKARGEYLGFVDSDDFIDPDMYERLMEQVKAGGYRIVQASRDEIDENGQKRADVCTPPEKVTFLSGEAFLRELLLHRGGLFLLYQADGSKPFRGETVPGGGAERGFLPAGGAFAGDGGRLYPSSAALSCILPYGQQYQAEGTE